MRRSSLVLLALAGGSAAVLTGCISAETARRIAEDVASGQADPILDAVTGLLGPIGIPVKAAIKGLAALAGIALGTAEVATGGKILTRPACRKVHAAYSRVRHGKSTAAKGVEPAKAAA
jgi:hypothetical protein